MIFFDNVDIIKSAELLSFKESAKQLTTGACERCAYPNPSHILPSPPPLLPTSKLAILLHQFFLDTHRYISSNKVCKACVMLESLNRGKPRLALQKEKVMVREDQKEKDNQAVVQGS